MKQVTVLKFIGMSELETIKTKGRWDCEFFMQLREELKTLKIFSTAVPSQRNICHL